MVGDKVGTEAIGGKVGAEEIGSALKGVEEGLSESHIEEECVTHLLVLITFLLINCFVFLQ